MLCVTRSLRLFLSATILCIAAPAAAGDLVIRDVQLIDVEERRVLESATILIEDGSISQITQDGVVDAGDAVEINGSGMVAMPGFVNAHTHLWQHSVKGLKTASDLQQWSGSVHQFLHYSTREEMYEATLAAAGDALLSGVTSIADFASPYSSFTLDATTDAIKKAGLGGVIIYWNPAAFLPPDEKRLEIRRLISNVGPLTLWIAHGHAFLFDPPVIREGVQLAAELDLRLSEHVMETVQSNARVHTIYARYLENYGDRLFPEDRMVIQSLVARGAVSKVPRVVLMDRIARQVMSDQDSVAQLGATEKILLEAWSKRPEKLTAADTLDFLGAFDLKHPYVAIHGVWSSPSNIAMFARKNVSVAHNPESNLRLSSGIAPIWEYAKADVTVAIGTDGAASNDAISMIRAMRAAWNLQKVALLDATLTGDQIDAWHILRAATIDGAVVLGISDRTGSLRVGKEADIILLSKEHLGLSPVIDDGDLTNLIPLTIYSANARNVDTVISDGRVVVRSGKLQAPLNEAELAENLMRVANNVMQRQAQGKRWRMRLDLGTIAAEKTWFEHQSVRKNDTIDLTITNSGSQSRRVKIAMSGQPEGGAAAPMLSTATLSRFPLVAPPTFWQREVEIEPGESIRIEKAANSFTYKIWMGDKRLQREGTAEQLLVLVR